MMRKSAFIREAVKPVLPLFIFGDTRKSVNNFGNRTYVKLQNRHYYLMRRLFDIDLFATLYVTGDVVVYAKNYEHKKIDLPNSDDNNFVHIFDAREIPYEQFVDQFDETDAKRVGRQLRTYLKQLIKQDRNHEFFWK